MIGLFFPLIIKKIKAPIGDENQLKTLLLVKISTIKKIKAPIGDENGMQDSDHCSYNLLRK